MIPQRSRAGTAWVSVALLVVFVILLIVFIAQNNRDVSLHFLGASGTVSESVALVVAAAGGALLVVLIGSARILQLRITARRARREIRRGRKATASAATASAAAPSAATPSAATPAEGEAQAVPPEDEA